MSVAQVAVDEPVVHVEKLSSEDSEPPIDWSLLDVKNIPPADSFDVQEEITIDVDAGVKHRVIDNDSESLSDVEVDLSELEPLRMDKFGNRDAKAIRKMFKGFLYGHRTLREMQEEEERSRERAAEYEKEQEDLDALNMNHRKALLKLLEFKRKIQKQLLMCDPKHKK
jgi:hypothetical protein